MDYKPFVYGGTASMLAELCTFPIDTSKIRLQLQGQVLEKSLKDLKYRGMFHGIVTIFREEGIAALFSGIKPALLRQATYGTIKIGLYHSIKRMLAEDMEEETLLKNVCAAVAGGAISSAICNPTDVLKVRLQAQRGGSGNSGMFVAFVDIYKVEGIKGLYRGVGPTSQRASVIAAVELPLYDFSKKFIIDHEIFADNAATHFIASGIAGLAATIASNPIDVIKTRMMNQRVGSDAAHALYKSSFDCFLRTCKTEGPQALYKGFVPTFVRLFPWNVIFFMSYEQLKILGDKLGL